MVCINIERIFVYFCTIVQKKDCKENLDYCEIFLPCGKSKAGWRGLLANHLLVWRNYVFEAGLNQGLATCSRNSTQTLRTAHATALDNLISKSGFVLSGAKIFCPNVA